MGKPEDGNPEDFTLTCPIPISQYPRVLMAHGGGGRLMHQLIEQMFLSAFGSEALHQRHDAAAIDPISQRLAFTTDSYVVQPLFFPGGDIGSLAVYGTVNDLAMAGARSRYLSVGFILEEGLPMPTLWRVVQSMQRAATNAQVEIVTGDTKVVDRGKGDGLFINTAGIGVMEHDLSIAPQQIRTDDAVLLSGDVGRHGMAIMAAREELAFASPIESDAAAIAAPVLALLHAGIEVHCLRDLTRGGLASALNELAAAAQVAIAIDESLIPVRQDVQGACEILGFDPLYVANEGRFIAFVPPHQVEPALAILRSPQLDPNGGRSPDLWAQAIGQVRPHPAGRVTLTSPMGTQRLLDMISGEQLPRIC